MVLVTVVLLFLVFTIVVLRLKRTAYLPIVTNKEAPVPTGQTNQIQPAAGNYSYRIVPEKTTVHSGDRFTLRVELKAVESQIDGGDAIILFDPASLEILEVGDGDVFSLMLRKTIDRQSGRMHITGFRPKAGVETSEWQSFFTIDVRAAKQGTAAMYFDFLPGNTRGSIMVEHGTSKNILDSVSGAEIEIL